jgi:integrase
MQSVAPLGVPRATDAQTLDEWSREYLDFAVHLKPTTKALYKSLLRAHILPTFGALPLAEIEGLAIRRWVADMHASGLAASSIRHCYGLLSQILVSAIECGLLDRDPSRGVKLPRLVRSEMACLSPEEVERLASVVPPEYRPLIHVLAYAGLRWGEVAALRRFRCDLDANRLIVAESLALVNGRAVFGETKTRQVRKTRLPAFLVDELRTHLDTISPRADALVFTAPRGGPLLGANFRPRVWWPALEAAGLPHEFRIHDLRHTCASLLIRQGVHPKSIQHHLGHSSIQITMDRYGHLLPDQFDDLASQLDGLHAHATENAGTTRKEPNP